MHPMPPDLPGDFSRGQLASIATARASIRLSHLMLIIAATAIGIVGIRNCDSQMREIQIDRRNLVNWLVLASPMLMSLTLALTIARLLPPRPLLLESFRQPGHVANLVTSLIIGFTTIRMFSMNFEKFTHIDIIIKLFNYGYYWPTVSDNGGGVLVAWLTLAMAGCW
jgi:hypothetical protein